MFPEILFVYGPQQPLQDLKCTEDIEEAVVDYDGSLVATYELVHIKKYAAKIVCED